MKKGFIVSKIESTQDRSPYVFVGFTDPNEPKSAGGGGNGSYPQSPFTSPEDLMKIYLRLCLICLMGVEECLEIPLLSESQ